MKSDIYKTNYKCSQYRIPCVTILQFKSILFWKSILESARLVLKFSILFQPTRTPFSHLHVQQNQYAILDNAH